MTDEERTGDLTEDPVEEGADETAEGTDEAAVGAQAGPEPDFGPEGPPADTDVFDMLRAAIGLFAQEGWIALGLQPRYGSSDTQMDLRCAKVAIDTTQMLVEQLGDEADPDEKREFDRTLTDLRVNFMRRSKRADEEQA
jgi:hypothetical protein